MFFFIDSSDQNADIHLVLVVQTSCQINSPKKMSIENLLEKVSFTEIFFINLVKTYTLVELKYTSFSWSSWTHSINLILFSNQCLDPKKTQQTSQKYILRNIKLFDCRRLIGCFVKRTFSICVRHCVEMCHFPVLRLVVDKKVQWK